VALPLHSPTSRGRPQLARAALLGPDALPPVGRAPFPQVQYSLLDRRPENEMAAYCLQRGVQLLPYGVVAGGLLSDKVGAWLHSCPCWLPHPALPQPGSPAAPAAGRASA
jgi:hypothetical protein